MPIVAAKCPSCGAGIQVDSSKEAAICQYCGCAYIVEKAINYNTISASVVNIFGDAQSDFVIRAGVLEKYNGAATDVIIPNTVKRVGREAFRGCKELTNIVFPSSVTTIDHNAFAECSGLTRVTISESVTQINGGAFKYCDRLVEVHLPSGLKAINPSTFNCCSSLHAINIPDSVQAIEMEAFRECKNLSSIVIPASVTEIGGWAFEATGLVNLTLPATLKRIGMRAFANCSALQSLTIESPDLQIDGGTFADCINLSRLNVSPRQLHYIKWYEWISQGRCPVCGGEHNFFGKCKSCGHRKGTDYSI